MGPGLPGGALPSAARRGGWASPGMLALGGTTARPWLPHGHAAQGMAKADDGQPSRSLEPKASAEVRLPEYRTESLRTNLPALSRLARTASPGSRAWVVLSPASEDDQQQAHEQERHRSENEDDQHRREDPGPHLQELVLARSAQHPVVDGVSIPGTNGRFLGWL